MDLHETDIEKHNTEYRKPCIKCGAFMYHKYPSQLKKRKYCSHSCHFKGNKWREGLTPANAWKPGDTSGEKNVKWKGDEVGYDALHDWVRRELGTPERCEHCGTTEPSKYKGNYEWANLSQEYIRDVKDWIRLCRKCHSKHDDRLRGLREAQKRPIREMNSRNKSGYKNVYETKSGKFCSYLSVGGKQIKLGNTFPTAEEAYEAYKKKALELYGRY